MGSGRWDAKAWTNSRGSYTHAAAPTVDHIYTSRSRADIVDAGLDPKSVTLRESRDSDANPNSTALIVGLDVTASMGSVLDVMARQALGTLVEQIYDRKPITDPHIMVMGIGDMECDSAPLQVTQFEAENQPLVTQMENIYLERGGGGNHHESYIAAWLFAATRTSIDCFEKRGKKGYLFTVGDEQVTPRLDPSHVDRFLGGEEFSSEDLSCKALFERVSAMYEVYHIVVAEGHYAGGHLEEVKKSWNDVIGQRLIVLQDHTKLAEVVVSAIQMAEGVSKEEVVESWSGDTSVVVADAVANIVAGDNTSGGPALNY